MNYDQIWELKRQQWEAADSFITEDGQEDGQEWPSYGGKRDVVFATRVREATKRPRRLGTLARLPEPDDGQEWPSYGVFAMEWR